MATEIIWFLITYFMSYAVSCNILIDEFTTPKKQKRIEKRIKPIFCLIFTLWFSSLVYEVENQKSTELINQIQNENENENLKAQ